MEVWGIGLGCALLAGGVGLLRQSAVRGRGIGRQLTFAGWAVVLAGFVALGIVRGGEVGTAYALLALGLAGYAIVAAGVELRGSPARAPREVAIEPEERPTNWPRAIAKSLLAIVLAGAASIGVGVAFAIHMPMGTHDRIVIGGVLVPILWGAGMAWTLSDARLVRATVLLVIVTAVSYGAAFLPKVLI
jgi:hypothetical protein